MDRRAAPAQLRIGDWLVDPSLDELRRGETRVKLEPRKMQLLMALAQRPNELVTTEELLDTVWAGVVVSQSSVYQSIAQLRKTLGDDAEAPTFIATVPRKGYRLVAAVSTPAAADLHPRDAVASAPAPPELPAARTPMPPRSGR